MNCDKTDEETNETQLEFEFPKVETKPGDVVLSRNGKYYFAVPAKESERCDNCAICDDYATDAQCPYKALCSCFYRADFQSLRFEEATNIVDALSDKILRDATTSNEEADEDDSTLKSVDGECVRLFSRFVDRYCDKFAKNSPYYDEIDELEDLENGVRSRIENTCVELFESFVERMKYDDETEEE